MRTITHLVVHCTAASAQQKTSDIINYWKTALGWRNSGYHWLISADGSAEQLTPDNEVANGVAGYNQHAIHFSYKGGTNGVDTRTEPQKETLLKLLREYKSKYPNAIIVGHRDLSPDLNGDGKIDPWEYKKLCPCFNAIEEYKYIKPFDDVWAELDKDIKFGQSPDKPIQL